MSLEPSMTVGVIGSALGLFGVVFGALLTFLSKHSEASATKREAELAGFRADLTESRNEISGLWMRIEQLQSRQDSDRLIWDARAKAYEERIDQLEYQNIVLRRTLERAHIPLPVGVGSKRGQEPTP